MENNETLFYRHRARFNELVTHGHGDTRRSGGAVLLPESHRLQRPVPLQQQGRVQRSIRQLQDASATRATSPPTGRCSRTGNSRVGDFEALRLKPSDFVYADPAVRCRVHRVFQGRILVGRSGAHRGMAGQAQGTGRFSSTRPRRGSRSCTAARLRRALPRGAAAASTARAPDATGEGNSRHAQHLMAQNTNTGAVLEAMILPALTRGGYTCRDSNNVSASAAAAGRTRSMPSRRRATTASSSRSNGSRPAAPRSRRSRSR